MRNRMSISWMICSLVFSGFAALASSECITLLSESPIQYSREQATIKSEILPTWHPDYFTNPINHDDAKFMYIVRVGNLEMIKSNVGSASVISNEYTGTYLGYKWAYILRVPESNVIVSCPWDTGRQYVSSSNRYDFTSNVKKELVEYYGVSSPKDLLQKSIQYRLERLANSLRRPPLREADFYNEILFDPQGSSIVGIIVFTERASGNGNAGDAQRESQLLKVPLIEYHESAQHKKSYSQSFVQKKVP